MNKWIKYILGVIGIIVLVMVIDITCIFTIHRPLFAIRSENNGSNNEVYHGLFYNTYNCAEYSIPQIKAKWNKFNCAVGKDDIGKVVEIKDTTSEIKDFTCAEALESFYEDEDYIYYWNCMKDKYMIVKYESGFEETISNALKHETITIDDLETYNIEYVKDAKEQEELNSPPELFFYIDDNEKAKGMIGSYSWKIIKDGEEKVLTADAKHPSQIKYNDINTLKLNDTKINLKSNNAEISSANIYNIDKTEKIKKISYNNNEILVGDLKTGEYVLEIIANYSQGNVCYSIKLIVE